MEYTKEYQEAFAHGRDVGIATERNRLAPTTLIITVEGGLVQAIQGIPEGMRVEVWDYDTETTDDADTEIDADGDRFVRAIWRP